MFNKDDDMKIDFVIAWVDGNDSAWQAEKKKWEATNPEQELAKWNDGEARYRDWDLLRYWFRGIEKYTPWVNKVFFVTWGHVPEWLDTSNEKLVIVKHEDFIPAKYLPTFNSHCIELNLHNIKELSDNFVYFNDDMFMLKETSQELFFKNGLPCDSAIVNPVQMIQNGIRAEINDMYLINDRFDKKNVIRENPLKWFNIKYGKKLIRTILMMPFNTFPGFYIFHLPSSFNKKTFCEVWERYEAVLDKTCSHKFRMSTDVNQWLLEFWQYCKGDFFPRRANAGQVYERMSDFQRMCDTIKEQKCNMICCNDPGNELEYDEFIKRKEQLAKAFESILKEKSNYEL